MFIKILLLAALIRLLIATDKPFLCAGIYAGVALLFGLVFGGAFLPALISAAIAFALASIYFWLLDWLDSASVWWWVVALGGILLGLV
jgi:hypothetical protein